MAKFPFHRNVSNKSLHQLFTKQFYVFLANFFDTVGLDPTLGPDEDGLWFIQKGDNGKDWRFPVGSESGSGGSYTSYFKLIDASAEGVSKISVVDGSTASPSETLCGYARINLQTVSVAALTGDTCYSSGSLWIHSWIDAEDGELCEIRHTTGAAPGNVNGGIAYANKLVGRYTATASAVTVINQDYLAGGEHVEWLDGTCEGLEIE